MLNEASKDNISTILYFIIFIVQMNRVNFIRIIIFERIEGTLGVKKFKIKGKKSILDNS